MKMPKKRQYNVSVPVYASMLVKVEATSKKQAIEKAIDSAWPPTLCHACSHQLDVGEINIDDITEDNVDLAR